MDIHQVDSTMGTRIRFSTAIRECVEETDILLNSSSLSHVAILDFHFPNKLDWDRCVHVFTTKYLNQEPKESQEMFPK